MRGFSGRLSNTPANQPGSDHAGSCMARCTCKTSRSIRCDISDNIQGVQEGHVVLLGQRQAGMLSDVVIKNA